MTPGRFLHATGVIALLLLGLPGCTTPLREAPPLIDEVPSITAGFYTVHKINNGEIQEQPGAYPFGKVLYLYKQEQVRTNLSGTATARFAGIRGVFVPDGKIGSSMAGDTVRHSWTRRASDGRVITRDIVFDRESARQDSHTLLISLGRRPNSPRVALRYHSARLQGTDPRTTYLAHRGTYYFNPPAYNLDGVYPANTLPAFQAALDTGYQGFELDVRVTKDKKFVASHDENLAVATDCTGRVSERTLEELRDCMVLGSPILPEAGLTVVKAFIAARLPSLKEVLQRFLSDERLRLIVIDVKPASDADILEAASDALAGIDDARLLAKLMFATRSEGAIASLKELTPRSHFALEGSTGTEPLDDPQTYIPESAGQPRRGHNAISVNLGLSLAFPLSVANVGRTAKLLEVSRRHGYTVIAWTVSDTLTLGIMRTNDLRPDYLLSDAPYYRIAAEELNSFDPDSWPGK